MVKWREADVDERGNRFQFIFVGSGALSALLSSFFLLLEIEKKNAKDDDGGLVQLCNLCFDFTRILFLSFMLRCPTPACSCWFTWRALEGIIQSQSMLLMGSSVEIFRSTERENDWQI